MPVVSRFGAVRRRCCLSLVIVQALCGLVLCTAGGLELGWTGRGVCRDYNSAAFVSGVLLCFSGGFGIAAYVYDVVRKESSSPDLFRTLILVYVLLTVAVVLPMTLQAHMGQCLANFNSYTDGGIVAILIVKVVTTYCSFLVGVLGLAFVAPDVTKSKSSTMVNNSRTTVPDKVEIAAPPVKVEIERQPLSKQQPALHLPEAKTHVQEAAGCGEKVTVVTLPEAEGVIYAVPEQSYVIRRGEATYVAPPGNKRLTIFFPTYTKMDTE